VDLSRFQQIEGCANSTPCNHFLFTVTCRLHGMLPFTASKNLLTGVICSLPYDAFSPLPNESGWFRSKISLFWLKVVDFFKI
jgi:hypothetical protein